MIRFYKNLVHSEENILHVCRKLVKALSVPITDRTLKDRLEAHPDYPSLLSMSDVLHDYGIANISVKLPDAQFKELETPFVALIRDKKGNRCYDLVYQVDEYYIDSLIFGPIDRAKFGRQYEGVVLLTEASENAGEKDFTQKDRRERIQKLTLDSTLLFIPAVIIIFAFYHLINDEYAVLFPVGYMLLSLVGWIIGTLLLWYEIDSSNIALKEVCGGNNTQRGSCDAVLKSAGASVMGFSWSEIGFSFFTAILFGQLIIGLYSPTALSILFLLSAVASSYIPFSLIYQAFIAKQWCPLCLTVQGVLTLQLAIPLLAGWQHGITTIDIFIENVMPIVLLGAGTLLLVHQLIPLIKDNRRLITNNKQLSKFKYDIAIFEEKLKQQKSIGYVSSEHLGITIGNPKAKHTIVKVCNPYCGPCARAHPLIDQLIENNPEIKVQVIFTASNDPGDRKMPPVRHLLAIAAKGDPNLTKDALDRWYNMETKDYAVFSGQYPLNGELMLQGEKIAAMRRWCDEVDIQVTPTFFVNGHQLPEQYTLEDLHYLLKS